MEAPTSRSRLGYFTYELECLHAIVIPPASNPATTAVDIDRGRELCDRAICLGQTLAAMMRLAALDRWLLPIAGGTNAEYGLELLSALTSLSRQPHIHLCQVFPTTEYSPDFTDLHTAAALIRDRLAVLPTIAPLAGDNVASAAIDYAIEIGCNAMILGASGESLLHQTVRGTIPDAIARQIPDNLNELVKQIDRELDNF